jgi:RecJ-like exonuclease
MAVILTHGDGDGVCSASLVKMVKKYSTARVIFTHPVGIVQDLLGIEDDLVVLDIAINKESYTPVYNHYQKLVDNSYRVIHIDHHKIVGDLPGKVELIHDLKVCTTELTYRFFFESLPEYADHFACIGAICDYMDNTPFMTELMHNYERRNMFLDAGILAQGLHSVRRNYDFMRKLVESFSTGKYPCEMQGLVNKAVKNTREDKKERVKVLEDYETGKYIAWVRNPQASKSKAAHWIMAHSYKTVGITINDKKGGHAVDISIRGRGLVELDKIIPDISKSLGGSGGGHKNAVGARIPSLKVAQFLEQLDTKIESLGIKNPNRLSPLL